MRIPQPMTQSRPQPGRGRRATQPSTPAATARTTGPQGTLGGPMRKPGLGRNRMKLGPEVYLWILVAVEVILVGGFRKFFRRYHGG